MAVLKAKGNSFSVDKMDEKFLDGPNVGYCSDSEGEEERPAAGSVQPASQSCAPPSQGGANTGPKGVLADYELHQRNLEVGKRLKELEIAKQANKMSLERSIEGETQKSGDGDDEEEELERIRRKRIEQLRRIASKRIAEIPDSTQFLEVIERVRDCLVFVHIYRDDKSTTQPLNEALLELAATKFLNARLYKVKAEVLGTTGKFTANALPTLQIYRNDSLLGSFIRVTDSLGEDFDSTSLLKFLAAKGIHPEDA